MFKIIIPLSMAFSNSLVNQPSVVALPAPKVSKIMAFTPCELIMAEVIFLLIPGNNFNTAISLSNSL